jgi:hypothetical protein
MPPAQAEQLAMSSGTCGKPAEGTSEGSCTTGRPHQLHHRGGDSHGRRSSSGTFFLNEHPVIILFDSGASYDFISSSTCAKKAMLSAVTAEALYVISTPGGRVDADRIVHKAPLELAGRVFSTDLIILRVKG